MKRIIALVLALVASTAVGAAVQIPQRNASGGGYDLKGVTDASSPCTGCVGEQYDFTGTANYATSGSYRLVTTIALPSAGDWMIYATAVNSIGTATGMTASSCAISSTQPSVDGSAKAYSVSTSHDASTAAFDNRMGLMVRRVKVSAATNYYVDCSTTYSTAGTGSNYVDGFAVRVR